MGLARNSDIFKAGVDFHGVHDWASFLPMWPEGADAAPDVKEARALAFKSSPVASIATWRSPVLLVHGDDDRNVPFQQTTDLVEKLRARHVPIEELIMPDEITICSGGITGSVPTKRQRSFLIASLPPPLSRSCKDWSSFVLIRG